MNELTFTASRTGGPVPLTIFELDVLGVLYAVYRAGRLAEKPQLYDRCP
jgi:hypothetical protein